MTEDEKREDYNFDQGSHRRPVCVPGRTQTYTN